ncbi:hypothetical protein H5410_046672 [Solanum commersonii]|uniref:Uncharacterized protein n=1 Tax=Solanum commersonii TaxID=4109 RepID=A0A9J5XGD8_SOLCO|nr:hypothetical protein H5410_046672 [Solanum commersonii]
MLYGFTGDERNGDARISLVAAVGSRCCWSWVSPALAAAARFNKLLAGVVVVVVFVVLQVVHLVAADVLAELLSTAKWSRGDQRLLVSRCCFFVEE